MSARVWISLAAISGGLSVVAGAIGAHKLPESAVPAVAIRIFNTGELFHTMHSLALLGVGIVLLVTQEVRAPWSGWLLNASASAFALGIVCFSGGIYVQVASGFTSNGAIIPFGGLCLIAGWVMLAVAALSLKAITSLANN